ncbi:hypothetical protein Pla110_20280 [Polystyrenella longa]|uniref:Uncharacterized protein n=1 Tax=Polystyrenella longa TaxID=2528007 RepID=A0A518CM40_9PLAN|nr:hypothetical protein [Polystyrenella longa]QDU80301.1 hypothetical protein Pla110_20280 [Polystyrenella longa]
MAEGHMDNTDHESNIPHSIFLVPYPKIVFMYPTLLAALVCGIFMLFTDTAEGAGHTAEMLSLIFLGIFGLNLVVLSFDFPRTTSLTLFFLITAVVVILVLVFKQWPDMLPAFTGLFTGLTPFANASFYFLFATILGLIFVGVWISVRFDYWEVRPNELLHHHGIWSDMKRYSAPNLRIDKEINDLFEYTLLRSGRLVLHPSNERRAIVLENVPFISRRETELTKMLGALQVQVRQTPSD